MASVRRERVDSPTHHDSTKCRSVTAHAGVRECKELSAPGESPEEVLSDRGPTPLASTKPIPGIHRMPGIVFMKERGESEGGS